MVGLVLNRTRPRTGLDERAGFRDVILTLGLLNGVVATVVASDEPDLRLVKPNGRGCDTAAIVDLLANVLVVVVVVVDWLELLLAAGNVVNKISVAESSTSFTESMVEPMSALGLTLDRFSGGSTLIMVMISVEVVDAGVVDNEAVVVAIVLDTSGYSSSLVGEVVSLMISDKGTTLDKSSEVFKVVLLNLCMLVYLKN